MIDIQELIHNGENEKVEFKSTFRSDAIESVVAFANTKGGKIFIGVDDIGDIIGLNIGKETLQNYINQIKQNTIPSVIPDIEEYDIDDKEYPIKPTSHKGRYYKRVNNSNHQMSPTEISNMHLKVLNLSWDSYEYPDGTLDSLESKKIDKFLKDINETGRFSIDEDIWITLQKLKLIRDNKPTIASMLLFAKEPLRMHIRVGRFKDDITIIDDRQITDTLFVAVDEVMKFIKTYMMVAYEFDGSVKRIEKWDYPITALREAVLNAIVHRDYREPSDIQIKIYDDKIVIASPGKLYGDMTLEKLKSKEYQSSLRNKLIAEAFYLTGNTEKYGSGFIRIENVLKDYPQVSYEFKEIANAMQITFYKNHDGGVSGGVKEVFEYIANNPSVKTEDISKSTKISKRTVERHIKTLRERDDIEFIGSSKTGGYVAK